MEHWWSSLKSAAYSSYPSRVDANGITINNIRENSRFFDTLVTGSVGLIPDVHLLVDIPGTPCESSPTIFEAPAPAPLLPDILRVNWTMAHLVGPDLDDIDPNPVGLATLSLRFVPTAAGPFGSVPIIPGVFSCSRSPGAIFAVTTIAHPPTTGGSHFDDFCLAIWGNVSANQSGAFGCAAAPPLPPAPVPEPTTLVLVGPGVLMMPCKKLRNSLLGVRTG